MINLFPMSVILSVIGIFALILNSYVVCMLLINPQTSHGLATTVSPKISDPSLKAELVYEGVNLSSEMVFLGPGDILVTHTNDGNISRIITGNTTLSKTDITISSNKGLRVVGIAVGKDEAGHIRVFVLYKQPEIKKGNNVNSKESIHYQLYRYEWVENKLTDYKLLFDIGIDSHTANSEPAYGSKIIIDSDKNIYISIGDIGNHDTKAQNINNGLYPDGTGGILKISKDGNVVKPILGDKFPLNLYYAYGVRNSLGMDIDPISGYLWDTENGKEYGDEINLVEPGFNSGWKMVQGMSNASRVNTDKFVKFPGISSNENGLLGIIEKFVLELQNKVGKYSDPEFVWTDTIGISALKFLDSNKLGGQYLNDLFVGDQNGYLYHFKLNNERTHIIFSDPNSHLNDHIANNKAEGAEPVFATGFGSIKDIVVGADGYMYLLTSYQDHGKIYRIIPTIDR